MTRSGFDWSMGFGSPKLVVKASIERRLGGGGKVVSCEVSVVSALVAKKLIYWAKAQDEVEADASMSRVWVFGE